MLVQHLRSPNRAVQRLFELAEGGAQPAGARQAAGSALGAVAPAAAAGSAGGLDPRLRSFLSGFLDAQQPAPAR
jgi:hypothetical protein